MRRMDISSVKRRFIFERVVAARDRCPVPFLIFEDCHSSNGKVRRRPKHSLETLNKHWFS